METFQNIFSGRQKIPLAGFLDFTPLSYRQKQHLAKVYTLLATSVALTTLGVQFSLRVIALPVFLGFLVQLGCVFYIGSTSGEFLHGQYDLKNPRCVKRLGAFGALAFFSGISLAPFIHYANYVHPSILPTAFLATLAVFLCFSVAALLADDRKFLYLGGVLTSVLGYLSLVSLFNIFFRSKLAHDVILYGGLLSYMGFVLYDTQAILFDINRGIEDPVVRVPLYVIGIFVKVVHILIEREQRSQRDEERRRHRN